MKRIFMGITSAIMALCICFSLASCSLSAMPDFYDTYLFNSQSNQSGESEKSEETINNMNTAIGDTEAREEITISKQEPQNKENNGLTSAGQAYNTFTEVYYAVADSVVEITTETVQTSIWMGQYISEGAGSGVIIDKSGLIVTNHHVIEGANYVTVRLTDGSEYEASLIGTDVSADLAVIKIDPEGKELCVAPMGCSADLVVGENVVAIGNPLGSLGGTLTTGIISATERNITIDGEEMVLLQTNAAINPGNSGGGLFNMAGQLIGVVNAKASGEDIEGLGFAIPIDFAHGVMEDLINYGYVRGIVDHGLVIINVTSTNIGAAYRKYGITTTGVFIIASQYSNEFEFCDRIVTVGGEEIDDPSDVDLICKRFSVGDKVAFAVARGNDIVEIELELREKIPDRISFE